MSGPALASVIIADDDADLRELIGITVARAGLRLAGSFQDGETAWSAVLSLRPDIVLLDVSMPGLTGLEVCRRIRAEPSLDAVRVLLLTAAVSEESRDEGLQAGADEYLIKPFSPRELLERLRAAAAPQTVGP